MSPVSLFRVSASARAVRPPAHLRPLRRGVASATVALLAAGLMATTTPAAQADPPTVTRTASWGYNAQGQTNVPAGLTDQTDTVVAAGGYHSLALTGDGHITAWGYNGYAETDVPTSLADQTVTAIAAGLLHNLALTVDGHVTAWGYNAQGQTTVPTGLADQTVTAIAAGAYHSLALTGDGHVTAWGDDADGETDVPTSLADQTVTAIAAGWSHSLALTSDGHVTAWGNNADGETDVPTSLADQTVTAIAGGEFHSLALTSDGHVTAWGSDSFGQTDIPASLADQTVTAIAAGGLNSAALTSQGHLVMWGDPGGAATDVPTALADKRVLSIATGPYHTVVSYMTPISASGTATITGTPTVGETLTGDASTVTTDPVEATRTYRWLRDGAPITDATATSYVLTNADAGHSITFRVGATAPGYADATPITSEATGAVDGGQITLPAPSISGTPVVDGTLTASLPDGLDPTDASITWQWFRGATAVGDATSTYTPGATDVGQVLTVVATATRGYFDTKTQSTDTASAVTNAGFADGPDATITGTAKVGETLTVDAGAISPTPSGIGYQWYADGEAIDGATGATYVLQAAQRHTAITVQVTASRVGYDDTSDTSTPIADVATELAPDLSFDATDTTVRRGQTTSIGWDTIDAATVTASGAWTGARATSGTADVHPTALGTTTYVLEATNANGTTTGQVNLVVTRPATRLGITAPRGLRLAGGRLPITVRGLDRGEHYSVKAGTVRVASGTAGSGSFTRSVVVPVSSRQGSLLVTVTGSEADRTGRTPISVVRSRTLGLRVAKGVLHTRRRQHVRVTGLAPGEHLTVTYRGKRVSLLGAHADSHGAYRTAFRVGRRKGIKTIRATGAFATRNAVARFRVRNR